MSSAAGDSKAFQPNVASGQRKITSSFNSILPALSIQEIPSELKSNSAERLFKQIIVMKGTIIVDYIRKLQTMTMRIQVDFSNINRTNTSIIVNKYISVCHKAVY